jgi:hypothetical protein
MEGHAFHLLRLAHPSTRITRTARRAKGGVRGRGLEGLGGVSQSTPNAVITPHVRANRATRL